MKVYVTSELVKDKIQGVFLDKLNKVIAKMQVAEYEVEVQYSTIYGDHYSALVLAYKNKK